RPTQTTSVLPYTTLFRSRAGRQRGGGDLPGPGDQDRLVERAGRHGGGHRGHPERGGGQRALAERLLGELGAGDVGRGVEVAGGQDRKSTRLNSSHLGISY